MRRPVSVALRARSWVCAWFFFALCAGCDLDPIAKHDLCSGPGPISANCKQCQQPPYPASCPQCVDDPNNGQCAPTLPSMTSTESPDATMAGAVDGGERSGAGGHSEQANSSGAGGRGTANPAGSGTGATGAGGISGGASGNVAPPPSAGAAADGGPPLAPGTCRENSDCSGATPACLQGAQRCVPCTSDEHCAEGMVCDSANFRCVQCIEPTDCGPDAVCDTSLQRCYQCMHAADCHDPVKSTCSSRRECVDCEDKQGCAAPTPVCNGNSCVECINDNDCSGTRPRCTTDNRCVECLARNGDCKVEGKPVCIEEEQRCVQCIDDADCGDPGASHCVDNQCVGCSADAQCTHLSATPVCDASAQRCVECNKDGTSCGANACVPSTHTCSDVAKRSIATCATCESDEECQSGRCIPMTFSGRSIGNYCLDLKSMVAGQDCTVYKPYSRTLSNVLTIDGDRVVVCAPSSSTTCEAVLDAMNSKSCSSASQCGIGMGLIDSTCLTSIGRCSYVCSADHDCPVSLGTCGQGGQCAPPGN
jgi:Cys-rich repeat protein